MPKVNSSTNFPVSQSRIIMKHSSSQHHQSSYTSIKRKYKSVQRKYSIFESNCMQFRIEFENASVEIHFIQRITLSSLLKSDILDVNRLITCSLALDDTIGSNSISCNCIEPQTMSRAQTHSALNDINGE